MGERAFEQEASEDEVKHMQALVKEAMHAGAIGFSTSRTFNHTTADDRPVASRLANWEEVRAIVNAVGETGKGVLKLRARRQAVARNVIENITIALGIWPSNPELPKPGACLASRQHQISGGLISTC
jgi:N-acyl-D-aspartate/D-glutamate deacylase